MCSRYCHVWGAGSLKKKPRAARSKFLKAKEMVRKRVSICNKLLCMEKHVIYFCVFVLISGAWCLLGLKSEENVKKDSGMKRTAQRESKRTLNDVLGPNPPHTWFGWGRNGKSWHSVRFDGAKIFVFTPGWRPHHPVSSLSNQSQVLLISHSEHLLFFQNVFFFFFQYACSDESSLPWLECTFTNFLRMLAFPYFLVLITMKTDLNHISDPTWWQKLLWMGACWRLWPPSHP